VCFPILYFLISDWWKTASVILVYDDLRRFGLIRSQDFQKFNLLVLMRVSNSPKGAFLWSPWVPTHSYTMNYTSIALRNQLPGCLSNAIFQNFHLWAFKPWYLISSVIPARLTIDNCFCNLQSPGNLCDVHPRSWVIWFLAPGMEALASSPKLQILE